MPSLLQIDSSIFAGQGQSSQLANQFVAAWQEKNPAGRVVVRDLTAAPVPHLDGARFAAFLAKPSERTAEQQAVADFSDALVAEVLVADIVVIGLPLYNFGVSSTLKAYFDHIARAGVTFRYTASGAEGLLPAGKKAIIFADRGGRYHGTPLDSQTPFVKNFLNFLGIGDVEFVYAEGLNLGEESRNISLGQAREQLAGLVA